MNINNVKIYEPSVSHPYIINRKETIVLKTACSAGVNRSATVREYVMSNISKNSVVYSQYGALHGDYDNKEIVTFTISNQDSFQQLFGCPKVQNIQTMIFDQLGYARANHFGKIILDEKHKSIYKDMIIKQYWKSHNENYKNIFILINEEESVIELVYKRLSELNDPVDFVILRVPDIIYTPVDIKISPQSLDAYKSFLDIIKKLIVFN